MIARRHHYVPVFYLRGFACDPAKPMLHVVDFKDQRTFNAAPKALAVKWDFHRVDAPGQPIDAVEKGFAAIEDEISKCLRRILESRSFADANDRAHIFVLMGLIFLKNPRMRETIRQAHEQIAKLDLGMLASNPEAWAASMQRAIAEGIFDENDDLEALRQLIQRGDAFRYGLTTPAHLQLELGSLGPLLPYIATRKWMFYKAPADSPGFVTSDSPVCLRWKGPPRDEAPGFGRKGTVVIFPLSNRMAIAGAFDIAEKEIDAKESTIAQINGDIIAFADRQVYARDDAFFYRAQDGGEMMPGATLLNDCAN